MWTEQKLNELLTEPSNALIEDIKKIKGDIMILGAGGKMGPTLAVLAKNAARKAGIDKRIIAVSRGSDKIASDFMKLNGIETVEMDLLDKDKLYSLEETENIIYMAGRKFGTDGSEWQTWAMNSTLPSFVADKFKKSGIVVFSSGNIYPIVKLSDGGCRECDKIGPIGEYTMSCLARERAFEYAANTFGTKIFIYRLNFAVDLRYGVLFDLADKILKEEPISLATPCFNFIWQGSANEIAIRGLLHTSAPAQIMNVTGPETVSIKKAAEELGEYLGKRPIFEGVAGNDAYLSDASLAAETFGYPSVSAKTLIRWQAEYINDGGRTLCKPTHFEERKGSYKTNAENLKTAFYDVFRCEIICSADIINELEEMKMNRHKTALDILKKGTVIPAIPLVLDENRKFDKDGQRLLINYYLNCGVGGIAAAVHTTQFEIRNPKYNLFEPVLQTVSEEIGKFERKTGKTIVKIAGVCGETEQAVNEAETAKKYDFDAVLLSPGGMNDKPEKYMVERTSAVSAVIPAVAFYLQTACGGRQFTYNYWEQICSIPNVAAIKCASFNRYQTLEVVRAAAMSERCDDITLYTGNDDNIVIDLLTTYRFSKNGKIIEKGFDGGLLGHWSVWTKRAVELFERVKKEKGKEMISSELLTLAAEVTDSNSAFFDTAHNFNGCIAGLHEILRRQGLMNNIYCLNPNETLSEGQLEELDRVQKMYPHLNDDEFVKANLEKWKNDRD